MQKRKRCGWLKRIALGGLLVFMCSGQGTLAYAKEPLVIVIDPGHGGENLGAEYEEYTEKDMTMAVARSMKEELEKYDNVTVYLTHDTDMDMSIKDRALFAKEKNADFLFCLHFNMSVKHDLFGAEVWIPAEKEYYKRCYGYAALQMEEMTELGLYSRGIKTKLNDKNENYYGILRYSTQQEIPAVLVEHCHLDHYKDQGFYQEGEEQLKLFGQLDARAAAKYLGLSSRQLGVDYSDYQVEVPDVTEELVAPDQTQPELCEIRITDVNKDTGEVTVTMDARDEDSYILYYSYSLDGGNSYSELLEWPRPRWNKSEDSYSFTVKVPFDTENVELRACAYNSFDVWTESGIVPVDVIPDPERLKREEQEALEQERKEAQASYSEITYDTPTEKQETKAQLLPIFLVILLILLVMLGVTCFLVNCIFRLRKGKRKR